MHYKLSEEFVQKLGLECAAFLAVIKSLEISPGEWFPVTVSNLSELTLLSNYKQRRCLEKLLVYGLIELRVKGMPATRYIRIQPIKKIFTN